jgi:glycosyltransferase involved in cell wall biosynthesis
MYEVECLDINYSTTRLSYRLVDDKFLDRNGKIKEEYKFKLNFPEFEIVHSKIPAKENEKFDTLLFLSEGEGRKGEGGLRTKGYFKFSYEKKDRNWYISNSFIGENNPMTNDKYTNKLITNIPITNNKYINLPLITIITVVYNGEIYLEETIQSVINQTYPNIEYIIIDGGSTDETLDIIKKYEDKIDYWISEKDKGIYDAMNKGLKLATGNFIAILNADDYYEDFAVEDSVKLLLKTKADYSIANVKYTNGDVIKPIIPLENQIYQEMPYPHVSVFIAKYVYDDIGYFDIDFKIAGDHDMAVRIILKGYKYCYLNKVIAILEAGGVSSNINSNLESYKVVLKNREKKSKAVIRLIKQIIVYYAVKLLPGKIVKIIQKLKGSRFD